MSATVTELVPLTTRIRRIRTALDRYSAADAEWREATLALAVELQQARREHASNHAFSLWLAENDLDDLSRHDREALISMGEHADLARTVLAETTRRSVRLIWLQELAPRVPSAGDTTPPAQSAPEPTESPSMPPNSPDVSAEIPAPSVSTISEHQRRTSKCLALPGGDLLLSHLGHVRTRGTLNKLLTAKNKSGRAVAALIVECIENGAFGPPSDAVLEKPTLRLALPWAPMPFARGFDLSKEVDRKRVRDEVLPVVLAHREVLQSRPDDLPTLIRNAAAVRQEMARAAIQTERLRTAVDKMAAGEQEIIAFGKHLWPRDHDGSITYDDLCLAIWFFEFLRQQFPVEWKPRDRALQMRQLLKWMSIKSKGWELAVRELCHAYEMAPEVPSQFPSPPINFGIS